MPHRIRKSRLPSVGAVAHMPIVPAQVGVPVPWRFTPAGVGSRLRRITRLVVCVSSSRRQVATSGWPSREDGGHSIEIG